MPLDAQSQAILAARQRAGMPSVTGMSAEEVRASRKAWRALDVVPPVPLWQVADRALAVGDRSLPVRVYRPTAGAGLPVIVFFHGGGWVIGDLDHSDGLCRHLCHRSGCIVVNVDYRLAPEHKYPAAAEDAYAAVAWLGDRAAEIGGDSARIAVAGSSAGGNLAAVAALMARDRHGPSIRAQLLVYPVTDAACAFPSGEEFAEGYVVSTGDMRWYWRQYLDRPEQGEEPYASPYRAADLAGLPAALIITAECDCIRDDGERYGERLRAAGVPARISRYDGTLHGFFATPGLNPKSTLAVDEAATFLRDALNGDGAPA